MLLMAGAVVGIFTAGRELLAEVTTGGSTVEAEK